MPLKLRSEIRAVAALSVAVPVLCLFSAAQQQDQAGTRLDAPSASKTQAEPQASNPMQSGAGFVELLAKKSIVFPNLATGTAPLSPEQKFKLFVNNSVSLSAFVAAGLSAGVRQADNSPAGYGQGAEGYGKRFGAAMARKTQRTAQQA